jgi:hypothetical protein
LKAQSELAGDRKSCAEMTQPHIRMKQQHWMSTIEKFSNFTSAFSENNPVSAIAASTQKRFDELDLPNITLNPEVRNRPAVL